MSETDIKNWIYAKYAHIRIPKALLRTELFPKLSPEAILLYGAMMDRTSLSIQFGGKRFVSKSNEVTIIFTQKDIMRLLRCKRDKARSVTRELVESNLITIKRNRKRGPYIITVIPQIWSNFDLKTKKADISPPLGMPVNPSDNDEKNSIVRDDNIDLNNTDMNNTDFNNLYSKCILNDIEYNQLIAIYGVVHVNRVLEVLETLFSFQPESIYVHGHERNWTTIEPSLHSLSKKDFEYVLQKMKKAKYTTEYSEAFILDALFTANIIHS